MTPLLTAAETQSMLDVTTVIVPVLFAVIAIGLVAQRVRSLQLNGNRSEDSLGRQSSNLSKAGLDELIPELQSFYDRSEFREGTIFIYQKLRSLIVTVLNLSSLLSPTEREMIAHISSLLTKQNKKTDTSLWKVYSIYEEAKFSNRNFTREDLSKIANLYSSLWSALSLRE